MSLLSRSYPQRTYPANNRQIARNLVHAFSRHPDGRYTNMDVLVKYMDAINEAHDKQYVGVTPEEHQELSTKFAVIQKVAVRCSVSVERLMQEIAKRKSEYLF